MANSRKVALDALVKINSDNGYSNIVVDKILGESELSKLDKAFATALIYGVLERKLTLEYAISKYLKQPINKLKPFVRFTLEMAFYQLLFMDKVPESAAVNEAVNIIKNSKFNKISGFVNAVLRSFLRDEKKIVYPKDKIKYLSVKYSVAEWIAKKFVSQYGYENTEEILKGFFENHGISIKVNTLKISVDKLEEKLKENCEVKRHPLCNDALVLSGAGNVRELYGFSEGYFHIQDVASQLCAKAVNAREGERVIDVCSAPGGKSFSIAENMNDTGEVLALDLYQHKLKIVNDGVRRLGLKSIKTFVNDASVYNSQLCECDKVLCDLPCSGLGILGKKPEIRYKTVAFIDNLRELQYDLLQTSKKYVKVGGVLIFSTCTLNDDENNYQVKRFLNENDNFEPYPIFTDFKKCNNDMENSITLLPNIHNTDGFFISAFKKVR